jgi:hypothetical protein
MVRWEGVEPPTFWFVARCSIQLSYQRTARAQYSEIIARSPEVVEKPLKKMIARQLVREIRIMR